MQVSQSRTSSGPCHLKRASSYSMQIRPC